MKILKGVLTYTLILIGILAIAGILLFASMAFLNFSVFGYRITISTNNAVSLQRELPTYNGNKDKTIEINSNNYNLIVSAIKYNDKTLADTDVRSKPYIEYRDKAFGLVENGDELKELNNEKKVRSYLEISYYKDGNQLSPDSTDLNQADRIVYTLHTPQGVLNYRNSYLKIQLPVAKGEYSYNLVLNSGKGNITIEPYSESGNAENGYLKINSLNVTTTSGNFTSSGLKTESDYVVFSALSVKTEKGNFDFSKQNIKIEYKEDDVAKIGVAKIDSKRGDFIFKDFIGGFTIKGENLVFNSTGEINTNNGTFIYNCPNGTLNINTLNVGSGLGQIVTEYAKVELTKVIGDLSIQATYGDTHIVETDSNVVSVETTHGNITIDKVTKASHNGTVSATSNYGDINVTYSGKGWFTNRSGKTTLTYAGTESTNETKIETVSGTVNATGLRGKVTATATGSANMNLTFAKISKMDESDNANVSSITIGSGKLVVNVPSVIQAGENESKGFSINLKVDGGALMNLYTASTLSNTYSANTTITDYQYGNDDVNNFEFHLNSTGGDIDFHIG